MESPASIEVTFIDGSRMVIDDAIRASLIRNLKGGSAIKMKVFDTWDDVVEVHLARFDLMKIESRVDTAFLVGGRVQAIRVCFSPYVKYRLQQGDDKVPVTKNLTKDETKHHTKNVYKYLRAVVFFLCGFLLGFFFVNSLVLR